MRQLIAATHHKTVKGELRVQGICRTLEIASVRDGNQIIKSTSRRSWAVDDPTDPEIEVVHGRHYNFGVLGLEQGAGFAIGHRNREGVAIAGDVGRAAKPVLVALLAHPRLYVIANLIPRIHNNHNKFTL